MSKPVNRLFEYLDSKGIKPTRFEKDLGLSNGYLGTMLKRNADLGSGILTIIIDNCRDLNIEWLLTGRGKMTNELKPPEGVVEVSPGKYDVAADKLIAALDYTNKLLETQAKNIERLEKELKKKEDEIARLTDTDEQKKKAS